DLWQLVSVTLHRIQQQSQDDVLFDTTIAQGNPSSRSSTHGVQRFQPPEERNITLKQSHATLFIESQGSNALHLRLEITPE
ncbi:MAG: hypothetical protein GY826_14695, partial [Fuerstiella sp.]|nr:hypothetical protein [Fuerstiella sp.]